MTVLSALRNILTLLQAIQDEQVSLRLAVETQSKKIDEISAVLGAGKPAATLELSIGKPITQH